MIHTNNDHKSLAKQWEPVICIAIAISIFVIMFVVINHFNPLETYKEPGRHRTIILQDGTRIKTLDYKINQWTLQTGITIDGNDYAGPYKILIGEQE